MPSPSPSPKVLLIGASGNWGTPLVREFLLQQHAFSRLAILARDEAHAAKFSKIREQGIEVVIGGMLDSVSYEGFDTVLSLVGNDLLCLQPAMVEAAVKASVKHFYPSEWGSDMDQREMAGVRYYRDKMGTRDHLHYLARQNPDFRYTLFVIGMFTEFVFWEGIGWDHEARKAVVYGSPEARVGGSSIADVARWTVQSLLLPFQPSSSDKNLPGRRTLRVQSGSKPYGELVKDLEAARGGLQYEVQYRDPEEARIKQEEARVRGDVAEEMSWSIRQLPASGFVVADGVEEGRLNNGLFDVTPETQAQTLVRTWSGRE